jgi:hypothetical protein
LHAASSFFHPWVIIWKPYIKKNYKDVLVELEEEGKITASSHRKGTFADSVMAIFPRK